MLLLDKINKNSEVIKHSGAVHITNSLSLIDRKVINVLLKNAFDDLGDQKFHEIRLSDLRKIIGWSGNSDKELKRSLIKLTTTALEGNIFGKDKKDEGDWSVISLLGSANVKKKAGYCIYEYPEALIRLFKSPNIYARLDLNVQRKFKSKHSIAMWEFLVECLSVKKRDEIRTEWLSLGDFRKLLDLKEDIYSQFGELNRSIIKPTVKEINRVSDIDVEFFLSKEGRSVSHISFGAKRKSPLAQKSYNNMKVVNQQSDLFKTLTDEFLVSDSIASNLIQNYLKENIRKNLEYVLNHNKTTEIRNLGAFTVKAIKENYLIKENKLEKIKEEKEDKKREEEKEKIEKEFVVDNNNILWKKVKGTIEVQYDESDLLKYNKWLDKLDFVKIDNKKAILLIKKECVDDKSTDKFYRDNILRDFGKNILQIFKLLNGDIDNISIASPRDYIFNKCV